MTTPADRQAIKGALIRYRVMAWIVGVMLLLLTLVAMPMKYIGGNDLAVAIVGTAHGWLYVIYLITVADLARRAEWPFGRMAVVALAGTIPFFSFVAERKVRGWVRLPAAEQLTAA